MAAGVPVVATAVGGIPEIVAGRESTLLVPSQDPDALCRAMRELLSSHVLARGLAARTRELLFLGGHLKTGQ